MLNDKSKQHVLRPLSHKDISRDTITDVTLGQYKYPYNSLLDVDNPLKKNDKRKSIVIKKSNHVSIGMEARKVERKQYHHLRMVDWKFLIMLILEGRPVSDCSFPFD